jgi:hypothetical protein
MPVRPGLLWLTLNMALINHRYHKIVFVSNFTYSVSCLREQQLEIQQRVLT